MESNYVLFAEHQIDRKRNQPYQMRRFIHRRSRILLESLENRQLLAVDSAAIATNDAPPGLIDGVDPVPPIDEFASIHGVAWVDSNGNGLREPQEPGLAGVTIFSDMNENGTLEDFEPRTSTMFDDPFTDFDETGLYWLGVEPGYHVIREIVPDGYQGTFPKEPYCDGPGCFGRPHFVNVEPGGGVDGIDFGNQPIIAQSAIRGFKWSDDNANGQRDPGEHGIPGVTIYVDTNNNGHFDADEPNTVTGAADSGNYWLDVEPGFHIVREVVPLGYRQTFPHELDCLSLDCVGRPHFVFVEPGQVVDGIDFGNHRLEEPSAVHGVKWLDQNGNGRRERNEPGLPGVTVYLDSNLNNAFDADEPHAITHDDGSYWIEANPGFYLVREVVPEGFHQTFPEVLSCEATFCVGRAHLVNLHPGDILEGIDFGNHPLDEPASIHGIKWLDRNGNGRRDPSEPGLPGVTIFLDLNNNGRLERHEPRTETMKDDPDTDFDEGGRYWLSGLEPGRYVVREVVPDGFEQTFPLRATDDGIVPLPPIEIDEFSVVHPESIDIQLAPGEVLTTDVSITVLPVCIRAIDMDVIASDPDAHVDNLSGVQINGCGGDTSTFEVQFVGGQRSREFQLQFVDALNNSIQGSIPVTMRVAGVDGGHVVVLRSGDVAEGIDFGNRPLPSGSIHGVKWRDDDGDGQRDQGEPLLPGVVVYVDLNRNGQFDDDEPFAETMKDDPTTDFDESGRYWIEELPAGHHIVREVVPDGYIQTFPHGPGEVLQSKTIDVARSGAIDFDLTDIRVGPTGIGDPSVAVEMTVLWNDTCGTLLPQETTHEVVGNDIFIAMFGHQVGDACAEVLSPESQSINVGTLAAGDYSVFAILNEPDADGAFGPTKLVEGALRVHAGGGHEVWLEPNQTVDGVDFGNQSIYLIGDTDRDGDVEFDDFVTLSNNFRRGNDKDWSDGDFDRDMVVSFRDFVDLSRNFGKSLNSRNEQAHDKVLAAIDDTGLLGQL